MKSNILIMSPLPSVSQAYPFLIQDEKQRKIHVNHHPEESAFLDTNRFGNQKQGSFDSKQKGIYEGKRNNLLCSDNKKPGHLAEIMGFPANLKFTKSKKYQGGAHSNTAYTEGENAAESFNGFVGDSRNKSITQDKFNQLFSLLQQVKVGQSEQTPLTIMNVNCAGKQMTYALKPSDYSFLVNTRSWILDSRASKHMTLIYLFFFISNL